MSDVVAAETGRFSILDAADERWRAYIGAHRDANIFHHPAWMALLAECYGYRPFVIAITDGGDNIRAALPMMEVGRQLTGRRWVALPFTDHCSPLCSDEESLHALLQALVGLQQSGRVSAVEVRWGLPPHPAIREHCEHVWHTFDLTGGSEAILARLQAHKRRLVRTQIRKGLDVDIGVSDEHVQAFYQLHVLTRQRQGVPVQPYRFFRLLQKHLLAPGLGFIALARHGNEFLAGSVFLRWRDVLTYKYSASSGESLDLRPNDRVMWAAIECGCENACRLLDLGRTEPSNTGLRDFKCRWGAQEVPLCYSSLGAQPVQSAMARWMPLVQTIIRRSPTWVCRGAGEILYRYWG